MLSWALGRRSEHSLSGAPVPHAGLGVRVLPATSSAPRGAGSGLTALLELPRAAGEERSLFFFCGKALGVLGQPIPTAWGPSGARDWSCG